MKRSMLFLSCIAVFYIIVGCGPSIRTGYDYDVEKDFSVFKTYDFLTQPENTQMSELVLKRVKQAIQRELAPKGLVQTSENPDLLIAIHTQVRSKVNVTTYGYYYAPYTVYWGSYGYYGNYGLDVREYRKGTLLLDFVDARSKQMIWRGAAEGVLPEIPRYEQIEKLVNSAVKSVMKYYPPPPGKK